MSSYLRPRLLGPLDDVASFACVSDEQTSWLRRHARQAHATGTARVLVVTEPASDVVVAYYAWTMASVSPPELPERARRGAGRYPQPFGLLARLGVDRSHAGRGLGAGLVQDVVARAAALGDEIGCRGLLVHCETVDAQTFYRHLAPELEESPTDEMHLVLLMKDIRRSLR